MWDGSFRCFRPVGPVLASSFLRFCQVSVLLLDAFRFRPILLLPCTTPVLLSNRRRVMRGWRDIEGVLAVLRRRDRVCVDRGGFLALVLLGPGAYSLDAHIFGRRVIVLPTDNLR